MENLTVILPGFVWTDCMVSEGALPSWMSHSMESSKLKMLSLRAAVLKTQDPCIVFMDLGERVTTIKTSVSASVHYRRCPTHCRETHSRQSLCSFLFVDYVWRHSSGCTFSHQAAPCLRKLVQRMVISSPAVFVSVESQVDNRLNRRHVSTVRNIDYFSSQSSVTRENLSLVNS